MKNDGKDRYRTRLTHGDSGTRLYNIWSTMWQRVSNPNTINYQLYGGKGVKVCVQWKDYVNFKEWAINNGYCDELTLDRIDSNGNYEPKNCRWVSWYVQGNNRSNNHIITYKGRTQTLSQWAREIGMSPKTLSRRIVDKKWGIERALSTPIMKQY